MLTTGARHLVLGAVARRQHPEMHGWQQVCAGAASRKQFAGLYLICGYLCRRNALQSIPEMRLPGFSRLACTASAGRCTLRQI